MKLSSLPLNPGESQADWGWSGWISFLLAFFIFFTLQIASIVPTISILLILIVAFFVMIAYPLSTINIFSKEYLIILPAAVCLISTLWSPYPSTTAYYAVQFMIVVLIGIHMAYWHRSATIMGLMAASLAYLLISAVAQTKVAWLNQGASVEVGINGGKSYIGYIASYGALTSLFCIQYGITFRRLVPIAAGAACFVVALGAIVSARASGAFVGVFINMVTFFGIQWLARMPAAYRVRILAVLTPIIILAILFGSDIWAAVLGLFNKSADLTGRVFIWERAREAIAASPFLGTGFNGFWVVGNPDAEVIWNYAGIKSKSGFNFHNTPLEFAVAFGIPIAAFLCLLFLFATLRKIDFSFRTGDPAAAFGATILIDWLSHAAFESGGIGTFSSAMLLLYMSLAGTQIALTAPSPSRRTERRPVGLRRPDPGASDLSGLASRP